MKIKISFLVISMTFLIGIGCRKKDHHSEPPPTYCWALIDQSGYPIGKICDRTEKQMADSVPNPCNYCKLGGEEFCWLIDGTTYIERSPEEYVKLVVKCFGKTSYKKVDCGYCQSWYTRQMDIYKPSNTATYSKVKTERLCGDTLKTLYNGRKITLRETSDSLIVLEFGTTPYF
jgi:hypothetical protein